MSASGIRAETLRGCLQDVLGAPVQVIASALLAGGASKETWSVDVLVPAGQWPLLVRREGGGAMYSDTLSLEEEYEVLRATYEAGVRVPRVYGFISDLDGRQALVMERLPGESIGRKIVMDPQIESARSALPAQMAEQLAKIHEVHVQKLLFLPGSADSGAQYMIESLRRDLNAIEEPHPVIELGLLWLQEHLPPSRGAVLVHGDFRVGNLLVTEQGLVGVLDWEFAHLGDPVEDLGWPLVRAWRFGNDICRLGGIGDLDPFLERYNELTDRHVTVEEVSYWEVLGNVRWSIGCLAQARRHLSGMERSVELAILGRLASEVEYELLHLIQR